MPTYQANSNVIRLASVPPALLPAPHILLRPTLARFRPLPAKQPPPRDMSPHPAPLRDQRGVRALECPH